MMMKKKNKSKQKKNKAEKKKLKEYNLFKLKAFTVPKM